MSNGDDFDDIDEEDCDCPYCEDTSEITCSECEGSGENSEGVACSICDGDGYVECPECS